MVAQKRKTVSRLGDSVLRNSKAANKKHQDEEMAEEDGMSQAADPREEQDENTENPAEVLAEKEEALKLSRKRELKGMYIDQLKSLASTLHLEATKKDDIIEAVLDHEAKERADARAHEAKIRSAVVQKKQELEGMTLPDLKELCVAKGITENMKKHERVEELLKLWQEDDGVDKALIRMATDARQVELEAMDLCILKKHCDQASVSPFIKEIMVERLLRSESASGRFSRPEQGQREEESSAKGIKKGDLVDALLANEANRKKEKEARRQQDDATETKRKELKAMSNEALKKMLSSKGQEPGGKKDEMVEAMMAVYAEEEAVATRRLKLRSMPVDELKKYVVSKGLELGKKDDMVESLLGHEAKLQEASKEFEAKMEEVLKEMKAELEGKSAQELKDMCAEKGLKLGVGKEDRLERLLEAARSDGEADKRLAKKNRAARREELLAMEVQALEKLCEESGTNVLVKEVMVERLLEHESDFGLTVLVEEPANKKQKTKK